MILRHAQMQIGFKGSTPESVRCANMRHGTRRVIKIPPVSVQKICEVENYEQLQALFEEVLAYNN